MVVINVEQNEVINSIANNVIIFNKETQSYFKKDASIVLDADTTFRDAILGLYKPWSRWREKQTENDFVKYFDTNDEEKILQVYNEVDALKELAENRISAFDTTTILSTISTDVLNSFNQSKTLVDNTFLADFDKLIYVDQNNGSDMNLGTENSPVKTLRRGEELIIENSALIFAPGVYDITKGNTNSNKRYCVSGLASKLVGDVSSTVTYVNQNLVGDVIMVVDTTGLDYEARDIAFVNGIKNNKSKIIGITFKMVDRKKEVAYNVSISRGTDGVQFIDCVFDLDVLNGNITYNNLDGRDSVTFNNSIINLKKELKGEVFDKPYSGTYDLNGCFLNAELNTKIINYDSKPSDIRGNVSLISNLNSQIF